MLYVHGIGHFHPSNEITNAFLESLNIGTTDEWITERVGIKSRRTVLPLEYIKETRNTDPRNAHSVSLFTNAQTGKFAAEKALERAGLTPKDIEMVISGGCSPQYLIPAEASAIAAELGIHATTLDINTACSSFASQLHFLNSMNPGSLPEYILVVNAENNTRTVDYNDRNTAILWGDATTAAVVSTRTPSRMQIIGSTLESDPSGWSKVKIPTGGHFTQAGAEVQAFAIRKTLSTLESLFKITHAHHSSRGVVPPEAYFIGHQANLRMLSKVCEMAEISDERHLHNVMKFGNCGAAGAPSVLSQSWEKFRSGDLIAMAVVGAGLTWAGLLLRIEG